MTTKKVETQFPVTHAQQGIEDSAIDYYDVMVIGKTGTGKTTTADKLLVANPNGLDCPGAEQSEPVKNEKCMNVEDLSIWLLSGVPDEVLRVKTRLKNIAYFRSLGDAHKQINDFHSECQLHDGRTSNFELISNDSTRIRILDVPGFFGEDDTGESLASANNKAHSATNAALGRMRNILQIQSAMHLRFRRILYFLPMHGALRRSDGYLETELSVLAKYFGRSIFDCMVVIATMPTETYCGGNEVVFPDRSVDITKKNLASVLARVLPGEGNLPEPPILFISMAHTCETILTNVMNTRVASDHVIIQFDSQICVRCGCKIDVVKSAPAEDDAREPRITVHTESGTIPYGESTCHPLFVPKHTKVVRFFRGIVHVISFKKLFKSYLDEVCVECKKQPGSHGCVRVKTNYKLKGGDLEVDHTNDTNELVRIEDVVDENPPAPEIEPAHVSMPMVATVCANIQNVDTESNLLKSDKL